MLFMCCVNEILLFVVVKVTTENSAKLQKIYKIALRKDAEALTHTANINTTPLCSWYVLSPLSFSLSLSLFHYYLYVILLCCKKERERENAEDHTHTANINTPSS